MRWALAWWTIVVWAAHDLVLNVLFDPDPFRLVIYTAVIPIALYFVRQNYMENR